MTEFPCTCDPTPGTVACVGCRANQAVADAVAEERRRCLQAAARLLDTAVCRTVRKTAQVIIDRIVEGRT